MARASMSLRAVGWGGGLAVVLPRIDVTEGQLIIYATKKKKIRKLCSFHTLKKLLKVVKP